MTSAGQVTAQTPQPMHQSVSTSGSPSTMVTASTGQMSAHALHPMHAASSVWRIKIRPSTDRGRFCGAGEYPRSSNSVRSSCRCALPGPECCPPYEPGLRGASPVSGRLHPYGFLPYCRSCRTAQLACFTRAHLFRCASRPPSIYAFPGHLSRRLSK